MLKGNKMAEEEAQNVKTNTTTTKNWQTITNYMLMQMFFLTAKQNLILKKTQTNSKLTEFENGLGMRWRLGGGGGFKHGGVYLRVFKAKIKETHL